METVATFHGAMPTGVTVSRAGRIFVNFPRWGDDVPFTVAEVIDGVAVPYPNAAINRVPKRDLTRGFVSVQSVVVDPQDRLWVVDTGSIEFQPTRPGGPKLVAIDLVTNQVIKTIIFPRDIALPTTYLNDIRFDLRRGSDGTAYITDSSERGSNAIIVVDLATGQAMRRLVDHPSVKPDPRFIPFVEGREILVRAPGEPVRPLAMGVDGIAISPGGQELYYSPLASRHLYSVSTAALADPRVNEIGVARTVRDLGEKGASDGLESDLEGRVYATQYENNAIVRRTAPGVYETVAHSQHLLWPDTLSLAGDGYLYVIANQLHRQARFHGRDLRQQPYGLFRVEVEDASPIRYERPEETITGAATP
jgi:sugar lactone lactonase YvrE